MKNLLLLLTILSTLTIQSQTNYCNGWENGFKEGYCYSDYGCVAPVAPVCPVARVGENSYMDGYNRGFVIGKKEKESENNSNGGTYLNPIKPVQTPNLGALVQEHLKYSNEQNYQRSLNRNRSSPYYIEAMTKALKAYNEENYWECIKQYNYSKDLGWHNDKFELAVGVSCSIIWMKTKDKVYFKKAKRILKLSIKHGNIEAKKVLKDLKKTK